MSREFKKCFFLKQQVVVLRADGVKAVAPRNEIPFEKQGEVPDGALCLLNGRLEQFQYS